jgi:hypothetical protein
MPRGVGAQQVGREGQAVAVPAGQLEHRVEALAGGQHGRGQRGHADPGGGVVGHVDGVDQPAQALRGPADDPRVGRPRRDQLAGDHELALLSSRERFTGSSGAARLVAGGGDGVGQEQGDGSWGRPRRGRG